MQITPAAAGIIQRRRAGSSVPRGLKPGVPMQMPGLAVRRGREPVRAVVVPGTRGRRGRAVTRANQDIDTPLPPAKRNRIARRTNSRGRYFAAPLGTLRDTRLLASRLPRRTRSSAIFEFADYPVRFIRFARRRLIANARVLVNFPTASKNEDITIRKKMRILCDAKES